MCTDTWRDIYEDRFALLIQMMFLLNKQDDLAKVAEDPTFRKETAREILMNNWQDVYEDRFALLVRMLIMLDRQEDIVKAATDLEYRNQLYREVLLDDYYK